MMMSGALSGVTVFRSSRMPPNAWTSTFTVTPFPALQALALATIAGFCGLSTQTVMVVPCVLVVFAAAEAATIPTSAKTTKMPASRSLRVLSMCLPPCLAPWRRRNTFHELETEREESNRVGHRRQAVFPQFLSFLLALSRKARYYPQPCFLR